jgi:hypothetical protein
MTFKWTHRYQLKPGRWVFVPGEAAKKTGAHIKRDVAAKWKAPDFYFHLRAGGHIAAVRSHASNTFFYRADLDDFFAPVNRSRITRCLKSLFPYPDARAMASESVVKRPALDGYVLPYGFVQSPILASLALDMSKLGSFLRKLNSRKDLVVSVYVDDIIISSDNEQTLSEAAGQLSIFANAAHFPISTIKNEGPARSITAFNLEISHEMLRITEERLAALRTAYQAATSVNGQAGILSYVGSVNTDQIHKLM